MNLNSFMMKFLLVMTILLLVIGASGQAPRPEPIKTGDIAPDFALTANDGKIVELSKAVKNAPAVLVFYRGYWCPFCARQLSDLRGLVKDGEAVKLYTISIDDAKKTNDLIKKIEKDGQGKLGYSFLSDPGAKTIDAYGLRDPRYKDEKVYGIPYPAVYVIDSERKVAWSKLETDYKNRPSNSEIRVEIDKLKGSRVASLPKTFNGDNIRSISK